MVCPIDLEQRAGRIIRQGNQNPEVKVFRYVTESTFDAYLFQTLENKQKFISQIMTSKSPVRACDDVDEAALSFAEIKGLCAGNPLIVEKVNLDADVSRLKVERGNHHSQIYRLQDNLTLRFPKQIRAAKNEIKSGRADMERINANTHKGAEGISPMTIGGNVYTDRMEAGDALLEARKGMVSTVPSKIGSYRGLDIEVSFDAFSKKFQLHLVGNTTQTLEMGDSSGNVARIDNAIDRIPAYLKSAEDRLENIHKQIENAEAAINKPFPQEAEYQEKVARLAEVEAILNAENAAKTAANEAELAEEKKAAAEITPTAVVSAPSAISVTMPTAAVTAMPEKAPGARKETDVKDSTQELFDRLNNFGKGAARPTKPAPANTQQQTTNITRNDDDGR